MWHHHLSPLDRLSRGSICILITWPYHRTLRYFTIEPATRLAKSFDRGNESQLASDLRHWTELKALEFTFVSRASTAAAAAIIGIFSWNEMQGAYWLARALFYFSLSLSLWAIITSAQQTSIARILSVDGRYRSLKHTAEVILRRKPGSRGRRSFAELTMLYVWQTPLMLMAYGWGTLLIALTLHVCSPLIERDPDNGRLVAIFYLATGSTLFLNFVWCSAWVCWTPTEARESDAETAKSEFELSPSTTVASPQSMHGKETDMFKAPKLTPQRTF